MKKTALGLIGGALACAVALSYTPPPAAHAAASTGDFDLDQALAIPELAHLRIDTSDVMLDNPAVTPYGLSATYQAPYSAYTTTLRNDLPYPQTLTSQSNTVTTWDTTTSSTEVGAALRIRNEVDRKISITLSGSGAELTHRLSVEVEASFKKTDTTTRTVTNAWTVPSQSITVPANTSVTVQALMQRASFSGRLRLEGDIVGNVKFTNRCGEKFSVPVGRVLALQKDDGSVVTPASVTPAGDSARFSGEGSFSGVAGTSMSVTVTENGTTRTLQSLGTATPSAAPTGRSAVIPTDPEAPAADTTGITTFTDLVDELGCGAITQTGGHAFTVGSDGRVAFVADGPARIVSPEGMTFTSVTAENTLNGQLGLAIATDGTVWRAHDGSRLLKNPVPVKARATAGHAYVLGEDGRIYFAPGENVTVVSPAGKTFTSLTGNMTDVGAMSLAIADDGTVWRAYNERPMVQVAIPTKAAATAAHAFILGQDGRIYYIADGRITVVSPSSRTFTSLTGGPDLDGNRALAIANDGSVWSAKDSDPMSKVAVTGKVSATAGFAYVLTEDGRIFFVAGGNYTAITPAGITFNSVTSDRAPSNHWGLAIDKDGTAWVLRDSDPARDLDVAILRK